MKTLFITILITCGLATATTLDINSKDDPAGSLYGEITDDATGELILGAKVKLTNQTSGKIYGAISDAYGKYKLEDLIPGKYDLEITYVGYNTFRKKGIQIDENKNQELNVQLEIAEAELEEVQIQVMEDKVSASEMRMKRNVGAVSSNQAYFSGGYNPEYNTESYSPITENEFKSVKNDPLSTFAVDVDAASYSNMRRFLMNGNLPEKDAIRVEELINYFEYDYPNPKGENPFSITTEIGDCPWNKQNKLVHIGLQGERIDMKDLPPNNLVFLLDVSGSMNSANKLPLLKKSMKMLVNELGDRDRIAIVVYAGAAGEVLPSTPASDKTKILDALDQLSAGGSTAGGAGIKLAYDVAQKNFIKGGNNRVILATDGDFNIGMSSDGAMKDLIEEKRKSGVFLTCLGFGMGNYKDSKMETLANKGNGNYAYIDNILEAKKVLVNEVGATLVTIAKDVKIQVEFNPNIVQEYRLVGYENRLLNAEDFNDDTKDAGEIGAGHSVTALYEVVLKGGKTSADVDDLRYQDVTPTDNKDEILTVKFRYKQPDGDKSKLIEKNLDYSIVPQEKLSDNFRWSAAVATFGMILRDSKFKKDAELDDVMTWAKASKGNDENGYRAEFIRLVDLAKSLM